jgi:hypothetical protein
MQYGRLAATWIVLGLGYSVAGTAQTTDPTTDQRIRALEARVSALERQQSAAPAPAVAPNAAVAAQPAVAPAAVAPVAPPPPPAAPVVADWGSLHRGMTVSQVKALLGKPGDTRVLPQSTTFYYPDVHGRSVEFDRNDRVDQWSQP